MPCTRCLPLRRRSMTILAIACSTLAFGPIVVATAQDGPRPQAPRGTSPAVHAPVGELQTATVDNAFAVRNGPTKPVTIDTKRPILVRSIRTYHWNDGKGDTPGTISLRSFDGNVVGTWRAVGVAGQGGVRNAYWLVEPQVVLQPGKYLLVDSRPETWATNDAAKNKGFVRIEFQDVDSQTADAGEAGTSSAPPTIPDGTTKPDTAGPAAASEPDVEVGAAGSEVVAVGAQVIFEGLAGQPWRTLGVTGDSFESFGKFESGALRVDVPAGHSWAKIGIRSAVPVLVFKTATPPAAQELRFDFDPAGTSAYVVAIAARDGDDEWASHAARFSWSRSAEGDRGTGTLTIGGHAVGSVATEPQAPAHVRVRVDTAGIVRVVLPDGQFIDGRISDPRDLPGAGGYRVHAVTHAREKNAPAALTLDKITLVQDLPPALVAAPVFPDLPAEAVLFDSSLGGLWQRHSASGGDFQKHARLARDGLHVSIPKGSGGAKVGILSDTGPVWLTGLTDGGEVELTFEIEREATDGFVLTLTQSGWGRVGGNDPGKPQALFHWQRAEGDKPALADIKLDPKGDGENWSGDAPRRAPRIVRFALRSGEITIAPDGMTPFTRPWRQAADGAGFNIYAYAQPPAHDAATKFHLRRISMKRKAGSGATRARPAPGVEPLPIVRRFEGKASPAWEPFGVAGGNFETFARFDDGTLKVDVPKGNGWGKTGLLSAEPLVKLDERVWRTPTRIELELDKDQPQNLVLALSTRKNPDMWPNHSAWVTLSYLAARDRWVLGMRDSPYDDWSYEIEGAWMRRHWDGRLWIDVGNEWCAVEVPGGPRLWSNVGATNGYNLHATIQASAPGNQEAAQLSLKGVSVGLLTPDGMTAVERWSYLDKQDFDPKGFFDDLVAGLADAMPQ